MTTTEQKRTRTQIVQNARQSALDGRWDEAVALNRELLELQPKDTEAYNRLGRALLALGDTEGAYEAYSSALKSDAANLISRRNLQRLEVIRSSGTEQESASVKSTEDPFPRLSVFLEEVGKTWVTELTSPAAESFLARIYAGQPLVLSNSDGRLIVSTSNDAYVGEIERRTAEHLIELINGGNEYEVYALGLSPTSLRVILRELYRDASLADRISFPKQITETRAYLRERDLLRQRDEADFLHDEDDDDTSEASAKDDSEDADGDDGENDEAQADDGASNDDSDEDSDD